MILQVKRTASLKGKVRLPASKSFSIRAFIIAACGGRSRIVHPSNCDDAKVALSVAKQLGARINKEKAGSWIVQANPNKSRQLNINVRESGTVLRFVLPLLPLHAQQAYVTGEGTLKGRPNHYLVECLRVQGVDIHGSGLKESIPIIFSGGQLKGGLIKINGTMSSQFISALLIACPQLSEDSSLVIKGRKLVSNDYIVMTQQMLAREKIKIVQKNARLYIIKGNQSFKGLGTFHVPSDYGLAAFLMAAGALIPSEIVLSGYLRNDLIQADGRILDFLGKMGVKIVRSSRSLRVKGSFAIKGGIFSLKDCPDLVPIMAVLALFAEGKTRLCDIKHARVKESDRISDLRQELLKIGAKVLERENELTIIPQKEYKSNQLLDPHHDHRLAMAFGVLGLKIGIRVKNVECVSKSYPDFIKDLRALKAFITIN